jgi:hypothetical protein
MLSKLCASWLVILVLSPFTAPFSTCDPARPLRDTSRGVPRVPRVLAMAVVDTSVALVPTRVKARQPRPVARERQSARVERLSAFDLRRFEDSLGPLQRHEGLHTILRL